MQSINPSESVVDLAKLIVVNYVQSPKVDNQDSERRDHGCYGTSLRAIVA